MNRVGGRIAAALLAGTVLASQLTPSAVADPERLHLRPQDCRPFNPTPDDSIPHAWHLDRLHMKDVWRMATGEGVTVAVIDTGIGYMGSPYFNGKVTAYDYLGGMSDKDLEAGGMDCEHGTKVASLIAAARPDGQPLDLRTDFSGIAPDAKILAYRALSTSGPATDGERDTLDATIAAVRDATAQGADVINLSQAAGMSDILIPAYKDAVADAIAAGIVVVASAGNADQGLVGPAAPASFPGVISVGMTGPTDAPDAMSYPGGVSIGAPGADMVALLPSVARETSTYNNQAYFPNAKGTSYAAPIVSGVVALMLEADPTLTPAQVKQRLEDTADPPPNTVPEAKIGFGIVNPMRALAGMPRPPSANPSAMATVAPTPLVDRPKPDMTPAYIGVGVGVGAVLTTALALVGAIAIPPAVRRAKSRSLPRRP